MARSKRNIPEPEKKRRKAQALLEGYDDFTPHAARALSRILRQFAEGPEDVRNKMLGIFDRIVKEGFTYAVPGTGFFWSFLSHLTKRDRDERSHTLYLFAQIMREK